MHMQTPHIISNAVPANPYAHREKPKAMTTSQRQTWHALQYARAMCDAMTRLADGRESVLILLPGVEEFAVAELAKLPPVTKPDVRVFKERSAKELALAKAHGPLCAAPYIATVMYIIDDIRAATRKREVRDMLTNLLWLMQGIADAVDATSDQNALDEADLLARAVSVAA